MNITNEKINQIFKSELSDVMADYNYGWRQELHGGDLIYTDENLILTVGYGISNTDENTIHGFYPRIGFPQVDKIVKPVLVKNGILGPSTFEVIANTFFHTYEQKHSLPRCHFKNAGDLLPIIEKFKLFFVNDALPYFEKWKDLRTVSEFLNDIPQMEVHQYMSKGIYKKAVIWKLCNNPRYEEYMNWLYNGLRERHQKHPDGDINFKRSANAITELKEVLDKTDPIY